MQMHWADRDPLTARKVPLKWVNLTAGAACKTGGAAAVGGGVGEVQLGCPVCPLRLHHEGVSAWFPCLVTHAQRGCLLRRAFRQRRAAKCASNVAFVSRRGGNRGAL